MFIPLKVRYFFGLIEDLHDIPDSLILRAIEKLVFQSLPDQWLVKSAQHCQLYYLQQLIRLDETVPEYHLAQNLEYLIFLLLQ